VVIPLSAAAQEIVAARPQFAGDCVFSVGGVRPFNDFGAAKADFDAACGVSGWVIHDLRRTSRTLMSRAGIRGDVAELCLGHALGGMRGVYDRHAFEDEKRHAFEALAALVERILHPAADVVVPIAKARRK
jgi:integrase